jgi:hypothetical protein
MRTCASGESVKKLFQNEKGSALTQLVQREYCPLNRRRPTFFALHYNG